MAQKIRLGDEVIVISGNGASSKVRGKVTKVLKSEHKVIVEGYNKHKRAVKPNPNLGQEGGIVERGLPLMYLMSRFSTLRPRRLIALDSRLKMARRSVSSSLPEK